MDLKEATHQLREEIESGIDVYIKRYGFFNSGSKAREIDPSLFSNDEIDKANKARQIIDTVINGEMESNSKSYQKAREHYVKEAAFTFFNRIVGIKVMEANGLIDEAITERPEHGGRSLRHNLFLEKHPKYVGTSGQGRKEFFREVFSDMAKELPALYRNDHPYSPFVPDSELIREVTEIINEVPLEEWEKDDTLGWVYQYYNAPDRQELKDSDEKVTFDQVGTASQQYTPRWVVKFLVDNTLGKLWLEMHPDSPLKEERDLQIPEFPEEQSRQPKEPSEIKILDPACGSGNFLLYAFDLLYDIYRLHVEDVSKEEIPNEILKNNLHGLDIDSRAVQIALLSLYLKASSAGYRGKLEFNIASADLSYADGGRFEEIKEKYINQPGEEEIFEKLWDEFKLASKLGSLADFKSRVDEVVDDLEELHGKQPLLEKQSSFFGDTEKPLSTSSSTEQVRNTLLDQVKKDLSDAKETEDMAQKFFAEQGLKGLDYTKILFQEYDVVLANPPYLDSGDYSSELKSLIKDNFKGFHKNLYTIFIKRNHGFLKSKGKLGMITPQTFMFIKSYQNAREFIQKEFSIEQFPHLGLGGVFGESLVDTAMFTMEKNRNTGIGTFYRLVNFDRREEEKRDKLKDAVNRLKEGETPSYVSRVDQNEFDAIPGSPFVYWISDKLRETFAKEEPLEEVADIMAGVQTSNNARFLRMWWEVDPEDVSHNYEHDQKKWVPYAKGGPYKKWYGNLWWVIDWADNGKKLEKYLHSVGQDLHAKGYYFKEGITYTLTSSAGPTFRKLPPYHIFDVKGSAVFPHKDLYYSLGFLNSQLFYYLGQAIRPNVDFQVGDAKLIPFKTPEDAESINVATLSKDNIAIKKHLCQFSLIERNFTHTPLDWARKEHDLLSVDQAAKTYIDYELAQEINVLLNESVIDEEIFDLYELEGKDIQAMFDEEGKPAGYQPLLYEDDLNYLPEGKLLDNEFDLTEEDIEKIEKLREDYTHSLPVYDIPDEEKMGKENEVLDLYDDNEDLRDICTEAEVNPLSVLRIVKETNQVPLKKGREIVQEFLFDKILKILREDQDGIVPLSSQTGEDTVYQKLQRRLDDLGYETYEGFESYLKRSQTLEDWLYKDFFKAHAKRFSYSTYKGAIVWHLTSGKKRGFDVYVLHHKWSKDNLRKIRTVYLSNRRDFLKRRLSTIDREDERREWERIQAQIQEIDKMEQKIKQLEEDPGYNPQVDDGVGKNIAPLQDIGLTSYDLLSKKQKEKYLNAEW